MLIAELLAEGSSPKDLRWAIGPDLDRSQGNRYRQRDADNVVVMANIADLFAHSGGDFALDLEEPLGGRNAIRRRSPDAEAHWKDGGYMDPSEISVVDGEVSWGNGRHRMHAAHRMGHAYGPVVIERDLLPELGRIVRTQPLDPALQAHLPTGRPEHG